MDRAAFQDRFGIIGSSAAIQHVIDRVRLVARTDISVLIEGESGVGKELVANAVHEVSPRRHKAFVVVNCGAIPEGLIESELFGNEKGAYTGAVERRIGYFEEANDGTIFLDEIGEMPLAAQVRLLRVLETGEYSRVGSSTTRKTDTRVVAATNKDLGREVARGRFREDLYYRLSTVIIRIPPLRERREDIVPLFETYLHRYALKYKSAHKRFNDGAREMLLRYHWPGNVRELRNVAEQAVVLIREETLTSEHLRPFLRGISASDSADLVPVPCPEAGGGHDGRELELVYRALLELRMEMREMKEQLAALAGAFRLPVRHNGVEAAVAGHADRGLVILERGDDEALIEDVPYEMAGEEDRTRPDPVDRPTEPTQGAQESPIATLEDAERRLITDALNRFDGNRRQTARALGISERTLYRKLKELGESP